MRQARASGLDLLGSAEGAENLRRGSYAGCESVRKAWRPTVVKLWRRRNFEDGEHEQDDLLVRVTTGRPRGAAWWTDGDTRHVKREEGASNR